MPTLRVERVQGDRLGSSLRAAYAVGAEHARGCTGPEIYGLLEHDLEATSLVREAGSAVGDDLLVTTCCGGCDVREIGHD